jgi:hypothetical protein
MVSHLLVFPLSTSFSFPLSFSLSFLGKDINPRICWGTTKIGAHTQINKGLVSQIISFSLLLNLDVNNECCMDIGLIK